MRRFCLLLGLVACADATEPAVPNGQWSASDTWTGQVIITEDAGDPRWPSDQVTINAAEVKGDSLHLTVSFGGGCRSHTFLLLADAVFMESYPVQSGLRLAHDGQNDSCKALLSRVLKFDLAPLRDAYTNSYPSTSGIIRLRITGYSSTSVTYQW